MKDALKRRVEILESGQWVEIKFEELKFGDTFRLFEPNTDEPVKAEGKTEFMAETDAYMNKGVWTVDTI